MRYINTLVSDTFTNEERTITLVKSQKHPVAETTYIQVEDSDNLTLTLSGQMSSLTSPTQIASIDLNTYMREQTIEEDGLYMLLSEELESLTLDVEGSAMITVKVIE